MLWGYKWCYVLHPPGNPYGSRAEGCNGRCGTGVAAVTRCYTGVLVSAASEYTGVSERGDKRPDTPSPNRNHYHERRPSPQSFGDPMAARNQKPPKRKPARKPKNTKPQEWGVVKDANEVELDAWRQARKKTSWIRFVLVLIAFGAALALPIALGASTTANNSLTKVEEYVAKSTDVKPGKQAAMQAVSEWLNGDSSPFPEGTTDLIWDEARKVGTTANSDGPDTVTWSHTFSFIGTSDGTSRQCAQLVNITGGVSTPSGKPSLLPLSATNTAGSATTGTAPAGYRRLEQSDTLSQIIRAWAKAYVGKDANALTVAVADPNTSHAYQPASVGTLQNIAINWAVYSDPNLEKGETSEYAAVSTTITFTPYGERKDEGSSSSKFSNSSTTMLLLVRNPTAGSAKVVDWGPDGYIPGLKAYRNAVDKTLIKSSEEDDEDSSSSSTVDGGSESSSDGSTDGSSTDGDSADGSSTDGETSTDEKSSGSTGADGSEEPGDESSSSSTDKSSTDKPSSDSSDK